MRALFVALGLVAAGIAYAWWVPDSGIPAWLRLRADVERAEIRLRSLEAANAALRGEFEALREDPFAVERAVREELGWVRPGEVLVRVEDSGVPPLP